MAQDNTIGFVFSDGVKRLSMRRLTIGYIVQAQAVKTALMEHVRHSSATKALLDNPEIWGMLQASQGNGELFADEVKRRQDYTNSRNEDIRLGKLDAAIDLPTTGITVIDTKELEESVKAFYADRMQKAVQSNPEFARAWQFPTVEFSYEVEAVKLMQKQFPDMVVLKDLTEGQIAELKDIDSAGWADMEIQELGRFCEMFCTTVK